MDHLNWLVICKVKPSKFEQEQEKIVAAFEMLISAEDFINSSIPEETRKQFFIIHK